MRSGVHHDHIDNRRGEEIEERLAEENAGGKELDEICPLDTHGGNPRDWSFRGVAHLFRDGLDRALAGEGQYILYAYVSSPPSSRRLLVIAARELLVGLIRERTTADLRYQATKQLTYLPMPVLDSMHSGDNYLG